jgi:hypothetical protein
MQKHNFGKKILAAILIITMAAPMTGHAELSKSAKKYYERAKKQCTKLFKNEDYIKECVQGVEKQEELDRQSTLYYENERKRCRETFKDKEDFIERCEQRVDDEKYRSEKIKSDERDFLIKWVFISLGIAGATLVCLYCLDTCFAVLRNYVLKKTGEKIFGGKDESKEENAKKTSKTDDENVKAENIKIENS